MASGINATEFRTEEQQQKKNSFWSRLVNVCRMVNDLINMVRVKCCFFFASSTCSANVKMRSMQTEERKKKKNWWPDECAYFYSVYLLWVDLFFSLFVVTIYSFQVRPLNAKNYSICFFFPLLQQMNNTGNNNTAATTNNNKNNDSSCSSSNTEDYNEIEDRRRRIKNRSR